MRSAYDETMACPKPPDIPLLRPWLAAVCMGDAVAEWGGHISQQISAHVKKLKDLFRTDCLSDDHVTCGCQSGFAVSVWTQMLSLCVSIEVGRPVPFVLIQWA